MKQGGGGEAVFSVSGRARDTAGVAVDILLMQHRKYIDYCTPRPPFRECRDRVSSALPVMAFSFCEVSWLHSCGDARRE